MALDIKKVEYFSITADDNTGEAYKLLSVFANVGVGLFAFKAVPVEHKHTLFTLFPNDSLKMKIAAKNAGLELDGPYSALIIKSYSDEPGECAEIFKKLYLADINIDEASGIADIKESYGVVLYLKQEDCEKAIEALGG